jgi:hypothetical protein
MNQKNSDNKELRLQCPLYTKALEGCPSHDLSSNVILPGEFELLTKTCTTDKYKKCSIFVAVQEKAA